MRKGKVLQGVLMFAAAAAVSVGVSSMDASAATLAVANVTINYETQTLTITAASDKEVAFGVATLQKKTLVDPTNKSNKVTVNVIKPVADTAWEWYDNTTKLTIDLASLVNTKDNYIQIKGAVNSDPLTIKIPAVDTTVTGKFDPITATVTVNRKEGKELIPISDALQYKTPYGTWTAYSTATDLSIHQTRGATLTFRVKPSAAQTVKAITTKVEDIYTSTATYDNLEQDVVYLGQSFPGKEIKVAVAKLANAPKITINYLNDTFTLPKNTQYRVNVPALGTWSEVESATKAVTLRAADTLASMSKVTAAITTASVEIRTAATATAPASKLSRTAISPVGTITSRTTSSTMTAANLLKQSITKNWVVGTGTAKTASAVEVEATPVVSKTGAVTGFKVAFINHTTDKYQIVVDTKDSAGNYNYSATNLPPVDVSVDIKAKTVAGVAVKAIAAGTINSKTGEFTDKTTTLTLQEDQQVYISKVGDAKTGTWATKYVVLGTITE